MKNIFRIIFSPLLLAMWLSWAFAIGMYALLMLLFAPLFWLISNSTFAEAIRLPFHCWHLLVIEMPLEGLGYRKNEYAR